MPLPKLHVAVLMGGWSNERPVSLMSGEGVAKALEARGHQVTRIDMGRDVAARLAEAAPDVVFNALHGSPGEPWSALNTTSGAVSASRCATSRAMSIRVTRWPRSSSAEATPSPLISETDRSFDHPPIRTAT